MTAPDSREQLQRWPPHWKSALVASALDHPRYRVQVIEEVVTVPVEEGAEAPAMRYSLSVERLHHGLSSHAAVTGLL